MNKKKCALILITGDRIDYLDNSIECCTKFLKQYDEELEIDIYLVSFENLSFQTKHHLKNLTYAKTDLDSEIVLNFPRTVQQVQNYSHDLQQTKRISFGHLILCGLVPNTIHYNKLLLEKYDYILKSRTDLIFDIKKENFDKVDIDKEVLTFECFWGGCRYNPHFTNDHFVFGKSEDVLKIISYDIKECQIDKFWNPEQYATYLFQKTLKYKKELTTDKYFLLSRDRESRKWIGFPLEKINSKDIEFLSEIGIDIEKIKFVNDYE